MWSDECNFSVFVNDLKLILRKVFFNCQSQMILVYAIVLFEDKHSWCFKIVKKLYCTPYGLFWPHSTLSHGVHNPSSGFQLKSDRGYYCTWISLFALLTLISTYSWAFRGRFWLSNLYYSFDVMRSHVYYLFVINCLETLNGSLANFCFCCHLQRYFVSSNFDCFNSVGIKNKSCCFFLAFDRYNY